MPSVGQNNSECPDADWDFLMFVFSVSQWLTHLGCRSHNQPDSINYLIRFAVVVNVNTVLPATLCREHLINQMREMGVGEVTRCAWINVKWYVLLRPKAL